MRAGAFGSADNRDLHGVLFLPVVFMRLPNLYQADLQVFRTIQRKLDAQSVLLRDGLKSLIRVESAKRLIALGGSDPEATAAPRQRGQGA